MQRRAAEEMEEIGIRVQEAVTALRDRFETATGGARMEKGPGLKGLRIRDRFPRPMRVRRQMPQPGRQGDIVSDLVRLTRPRCEAWRKNGTILGVVFPRS